MNHCLSSGFLITAYTCRLSFLLDKEVGGVYSEFQCRPTISEIWGCVGGFKLLEKIQNLTKNWPLEPSFFKSNF
jgi:hypothetical protein